MRSSNQYRRERGEDYGENRQRKDPYEVLGVNKNATPTQIKSAYRRLAMKVHPDRIQGDEATKAKAGEKFTEISAAYELLTRGRGSDEASHPSFGAGRAQDTGDVSTAGYPYEFEGQRATGFGFGGAFPFGNGGFPDLFGRRVDPFGFGPMPGFVFSDPFELFRNTFGASEVMDESAAISNTGFGEVFPSVSNSGFGGLFPSMFGSMAAGQAPQFPVSQGQNFSSYSFSSSTQGGGDGGKMRTVTTTTSIHDGKKVTKTETVFINEDGSRETIVDLAGDGDNTSNAMRNPRIEDDQCYRAALEERRHLENGAKEVKSSANDKFAAGAGSRKRHAADEDCIEGSISCPIGNECKRRTTVKEVLNGHELTKVEEATVNPDGSIDAVVDLDGFGDGNVISVDPFSSVDALVKEEQKKAKQKKGPPETSNPPHADASG